MGPVVVRLAEMAHESNPRCECLLLGVPVLRVDVL